MKCCSKLWTITLLFFVFYWGFILFATFAKADNTSLIEFHIKQNEGYKIRVYKDTRGNLTVGYGHKLPNKGYKVGDYIDNKRSDRWFKADFNSALRCAKRFLKNEYNMKELTVITDMAYQLGCKGLNEFVLLRKHINNKDYLMAGKAIKLSNYYKQTKNRAGRNIQFLKNK